MWNMDRKGFEELYERIPNPKPCFDDVWRLTGGNPRVFSLLYRYGWDIDLIISRLAIDKNLTPNFVSRWRKWLELVVEDPDSLWGPDVPEELVNELISRNFIVYFLHKKHPQLWIDEPPSEKDLEIGVGKYVAWQTPLHREAVKKVLQKTSST